MNIKLLYLSLKIYTSGNNEDIVKKIGEIRVEENRERVRPRKK